MSLSILAASGMLKRLVHKKSGEATTLDAEFVTYGCRGGQDRRYDG